MPQRQFLNLGPLQIACQTDSHELCEMIHEEIEFIGSTIQFRQRDKMTLKNADLPSEELLIWPSYLTRFDV